MEIKTALVTGANRGIGYEIAKQLAQRGFQIIISGRDEFKLSAAQAQLEKENINAQTLVMDVSKAASIANAAKEYAKMNILLDVLVNNAAIIENQNHTIIGQEFSAIENIVYTNAFGPLLVIRNFLPYMNHPARIINISSEGGSMTDPVGGWSPAYCVSKSLLNSITRQLSHELANKGIVVNAICPGWVKTDMGGSSAPRPVEKGAETPVWLATAAPLELTGKFFRDKTQLDW